MAHAFQSYAQENAMTEKGKEGGWRENTVPSAWTESIWILEKLEGFCISCCQGWLRPGRSVHPLLTWGKEKDEKEEKKKGEGEDDEEEEGERKREELSFIVSLLCARCSASPGHNGVSFTSITSCDPYNHPHYSR